MSEESEKTEISEGDRMWGAMDRLCEMAREYISIAESIQRTLTMAKTEPRADVLQNLRLAYKRDWDKLTKHHLHFFKLYPLVKRSDYKKS